MSGNGSTRYLGALAAAGVLLFAAGCANTMTGIQQSCQSSGGFLQDREMTCTGTVETIKGAPTLSIADVDEEFSGTYQLDTILEIGKGSVQATLVNADGEEVGGEITPDQPLEISETVELSETDEELTLSLEVEGGEEAEATNLSYESSLVP